MEKYKQEMKMTDDILDKFLSGEATEEEKNAVMEYMTESDEHLDELMCITEALREHREVEKPKAKPKAVYYRAAAAVAVLLVSGGLWFGLSRGTEPETEPELIAQLNKPQDNPITMFSDGKNENPPTSINGRNRVAPQKKMPNQTIGSTTTSHNEQLIIKENIEDRQIQYTHESSLIAASVASDPSIESIGKDTVFLSCIIPTVWDGDSLIIVWESNISKIEISLTTQEGHTTRDTIESNRGVKSYSASDKDRFLKDGKLIECTVTALASNVADRKKLSRIITLSNK